MKQAAQLYGGVDMRGRVEAATPHGLVQLLFDELLGAMRQAELCIRNCDRARKGERVSRALAILGGLESSLDHGCGGDLAETMANVYRKARAEIMAASRADDAERARGAAGMIAEIADAWRAIA